MSTTEPTPETIRVLPNNHMHPIAFLTAHTGIKDARVTFNVEKAVRALAQRMLCFINRQTSEQDDYPNRGDNMMGALAGETPFIIVNDPQLFDTHDAVVANPVSGEKCALSPELAGIALTRYALDALFSSWVWETLTDEDQESAVDWADDLLSVGYTLASQQGYEREYFALMD